jgi:hypothetical protein
MIRKRNDSVKSGCGIDGSKGENFSRQYDVDPWNPPKMGGEDINPKGTGRYTSNDPGLRNKAPGSGTGDTHDIFDNVCRNSLDDDAGGSRPGPIKYGVD